MSRKDFIAGYMAGINRKMASWNDWEPTADGGLTLNINGGYYVPDGYTAWVYDSGDDFGAAYDCFICNYDDNEVFRESHGNLRDAELACEEWFRKRGLFASRKVAWTNAPFVDEFRSQYRDTTPGEYVALVDYTAWLHDKGYLVPSGSEDYLY